MATNGTQTSKPAAAAPARKPAARKPARRKPGPKPGAKAAAAAGSWAQQAKGATPPTGPAPTPAPAPAPTPPAAAPTPPAAVAQSVFRHALNAPVTISQSGETGTVRARAEYASGNLCYFLAYTTKTGEFKEAWLDQDLLDEIHDRRKSRTND